MQDNEVLRYKEYTLEAVPIIVWLIGVEGDPRGRLEVISDSEGAYLLASYLLAVKSSYLLAEKARIYLVV